MKKPSGRGGMLIYFIASAVVCVALAVSAQGLRLQLGRLKLSHQKDAAALQGAVPDFDRASVSRLKKETALLDDKLTGLAAIFDPRYKWIKKDYDLSIYFIEELGNVRQFLKQKSQTKNVSCPELGFKERLPSEQEATYLLSQLYAIKETVSLAMEYGINVKAVTPFGPVDAPLSGIKLVRSRFEMTCPGEALIEFIVQLNEIVPKVCFSSLSLKSGAGVFEVDVTLEQVMIDTELRPERVEPSAEVQAQAYRSFGDADFVHILRSNNPFFVPEPLAVSDAGQVVTGEPPQEKPRFLYRGKARKNARQVVVVEDTLKKETVFLGLEDRVDTFILVDFSDDAIVLKNVDTNQELVIKRED